jgi:hypothetical protein
MSTPRDLSAVSGYAEDEGNGRLFSPSAARNIKPIADVLAHHAPKAGQALEIASGTGQHVAIFAGRLPNLVWQPTEIDATRLTSVNAWAEHSGELNILPAIPLNATQKGWGAAHAGQDLITLSNLLHLISETEAQTLISEAGKALAPQGVFHIYGPFMRDGETTSGPRPGCRLQRRLGRDRLDTHLGYGPCSGLGNAVKQYFLRCNATFLI